MKKDIEELESLLYSKLLKNEGILELRDIMNIIDCKAEYGLSKVNGEAIKKIRERKNVEQTKNEKGEIVFKLKEK